MIVSHRHEFIFLKPRKVAGTSIEVALGPHCGEEDIITPVGSFDPRWDADHYQSLGRKRWGYRRHGTLAEARWRVGEDVWRRYFKFSVVRNPWDLVVSQYHWATREGRREKTLPSILKRFRRPQRSRRTLLLLASWLGMGLRGRDDLPFEFFATFLLRYYPSNDQQYFDGTGAPGLDHCIRFEHLEEDFGAVCSRIGIDPPALPSLKTKSRPGRDYVDYYDRRTRSLVALHYQRQIDAFGYRFGEG